MSHLKEQIEGMIAEELEEINEAIRNGTDPDEIQSMIEEYAAMLTGPYGAKVPIEESEPSHESDDNLVARYFRAYEKLTKGPKVPNDWR